MSTALCHDEASLRPPLPLRYISPVHFRPTLRSVALGLLLALQACSRASDLAPLGAGGSSGGAGGQAGGGGQAGEGGQAGSGGESGATGKPCVADEDCGDDVECTQDRCDPVEGRCRNTPDDLRCADTGACNGVERCDPLLGCRPGAPVTCSDGDACTIDKCAEDSQGIRCERTPRDADGDGDPDLNCKGGDCDDSNPQVSSKAAEICGNLIDDNCNGVVDEEGCIQPANDGCGDPKILEQPGLYTLSLAGAKLDTSATCAPTTLPSLRDVVAGLTVPPGPPRRVDVRVTWPSGVNAVSLGKQCGVAEDELACASSLPNPAIGGQIARLRAHSLDPGVYPLLVYGSLDTTATVSYELGDASAPPPNETCATALPLLPGEPTLVPLVGVEANVPMSCGPLQARDLVYVINLDQSYDVRAFASPADGIGSAVLSLRQAPCAEEKDELACGSGGTAAVFRRKLGPGPVYLAVSSTSGSDVNLLVTTEPPTDPPADESCGSGPPVLTPGVDRLLDLTNSTDDHTFCTVGQRDVVHALPIQQTSDVLLLLRTSQTTIGTVSLVRPPCDPLTDVLTCRTALPSPIRARVPAVAPGAYRVVTELSAATPAELTAFTRKSVPPVLVPFADGCADAFPIPPEGGTFQGNTANTNSDFSAGCDQGGAVNAPDQLLKLELPSKKRVILDMNGSAYPTLLNVRKGPECPGKELNLSCTIGTLPQRSFLDLTLEQGTYFVQIDGFNGASGAWFLDVFVADP